MTAALFNPVDYAVPAFVVLVIAEMLWARKRAPEKYGYNRSCQFEQHYRHEALPRSMSISAATGVRS